MRFTWMIAAHLLEECEYRLAVARGNGVFDQPQHSFLIRLNTWWEPECRGKKAINVVSASMLECSPSECSDKVWKVFEILMRIRIHPTYAGIAAEPQHDDGNTRIHIFLSCGLDLSC
jgi:hypothetical protein